MSVPCHVKKNTADGRRRRAAPKTQKRGRRPLQHAPARQKAPPLYRIPRQIPNSPKKIPQKSHSIPIPAFAGMEYIFLPSAACGGGCEREAVAGGGEMTMMGGVPPPPKNSLARIFTPPRKRRRVRQSAISLIPAFDFHSCPLFHSCVGRNLCGEAAFADRRQLQCSASRKILAVARMRFLPTQEWKEGGAAKLKASPFPRKRESPCHLTVFGMRCRKTIRGWGDSRFRGNGRRRATAFIGATAPPAASRFFPTTTICRHCLQCDYCTPPPAQGRRRAQAVGRESSVYPMAIRWISNFRMIPITAKRTPSTTRAPLSFRI